MYGNERAMESRRIHPANIPEYATIFCDSCFQYTAHDVKSLWFHCSVCKRCYGCGEPVKCLTCWKYEARIAE